MAWKGDEKYVKRGEMLVLDGDMDELRGDLASENRGKAGRPFRCPNAVVIQLSMLRAMFGLGHREMEGLLSKSALAEFGIGFVQIWRRAEKIEVAFRERDGAFTFRNSQTGNTESMAVAFDGSGLGASKGGAWKREKWSVRMGFVRITLAVNAEDKKILAVTVTDDSESEISQFPKLLQGVLAARRRHEKALGMPPRRRSGEGITALGGGLYGKAAAGGGGGDPGQRHLHRTGGVPAKHLPQRHSQETRPKHERAYNRHDFIFKTGSSV